MYIQVVWNLPMLYLTKLYVSVVLLIIFMYAKGYDFCAVEAIGGGAS